MKILGESPWTSIVGYVTAGLMVLENLLKTGETSWVKIAVAVCIAVFGRIAADANK